MPTVDLEVPEELAERLDTEQDLLGFESREDYLRWIVDNRAALRGEEGPEVLEAYARRIRELECRLEEAEATDTAGTEDGDQAETAGTGSGEAAAADGGTLESNLAPSTTRITDDSVASVADELKRTESERFDELARRAVARTRETLGEGTGSGIDYRSSTRMDDDGPLPGADLADLDAVAVPGYDEDLVARRRAAVGAALAYLRDVGEARRSDFVDALYGEFPAGYDSPDGWWSCLKAGLRQVDRVDAAGEGSRTWRYRDYRGRVRVLDS